MNIREYYIPPSQEIFDDIKENAIKIWEEYDNTYGYVTEKVSRIRDIENIEDNAWFIVAMFDTNNIAKLLLMVRPETGVQIINAMQCSDENKKEYEN